MATALTDELTRVAVADIEKWEEDGDTLYVYGKCTTPELDTDDQVVDSGWSGPALKEYMAVAPTVRVQHNPQRDPAGSAVKIDVNRDGDGAHWLKAAVDEPVAQRLVKKGHLRAFSVGIARPVIERDMSGKARGGIIKGGKIVEVSLVDSPANRSCFLEIAKSAADGTAEYTGKLVADDDVIAKAMEADLTKGTGPDTWTGTSADMSGFQMPADLDITFTPNDMARLMQAKVVEKHYAGLAAKAAEPDAEKRDIDTAIRRRLASEGHALPDGSYPIENTEDLHNAAILARSGHGDAADAKRLIAREARERGVANPLDGGDSKSKGTVTETAAKDASGATDEEALTMLKGLQTAMLVEERAAEAQKAAPAEEAAVPDVTKDPDGKDKPVKKAKKKKKLPPRLNKPDDDEGSDDDKGSSGDSGACKSVADHLWTGVEGTSDIVCSKCHTTPAEAAGLSGTHDMTCAPVPEMLESPPVASTKAMPTPESASGAGEAADMDPAPAGDLQETPPPASAKGDAAMEAGMMKSSPEVAAILRFKRAGMDIELGRLHDLTCPAFHPEDVAKCHPFSDLSRIDVDAFQREAVKAACGPDLERSKSLTMAWQAAHVLKGADPAELNDFRLAAHKAFRDANPGPSSAPAPGSVSPGKYNRPLITDGHEASSTGHDGPNSSPQVAAKAPDAHSFDRPPLSAGHQSPSPSFMKASFEYPHETGRPVHLDYAVMEKERARHALMQMHEHLSRQFPEVCPMSLDAPPVQPESRGVPPTAGIGKGEGVGGNIPSGPGDAVPAMLDNGYVLPKSAAPPVAAVLKAPAEGDLVDDAVYKGFKKMRKKLGKKVLAGEMTVDEARAKMGRQFAQKGAEEPQEAAQKSATLDPRTAFYEAAPGTGIWEGAQPARKAASPMSGGASSYTGTITSSIPNATVTYNTGGIVPPAPVAASFGPEDIEAAVTKAVGPLLEKIQQQDETYTQKLAEQQRVIDAIADQPDPSTAAFSGLAFNPLRTTKSRRPAGVVDQADIAERTQQMVMRTLQDKYNSSSDPHEREAYYTTLSKMRGYSEP